MTTTIRLVTGHAYGQSLGRRELDALEAYLDDRQPLPYRAVAGGIRGPHVVGVRHDVDHDALHALRFAEWEAERGVTSSYYLLPTAPYYEHQASYVVPQLVAMGHEVGLHQDAVAAARGDMARAGLLVTGWLEQLSSWAGTPVVGAADHGGDKTYHSTTLWQHYTPADFGLEYEAYQLQRSMGCLYVSDNGGKWPLPMPEPDADRQAMLLIHPCHWQLP